MVVAVLLVGAVLGLASCSDGPTSSLAVKPTCTILCTVSDERQFTQRNGLRYTVPNNGRVFVSERTSPDFAPFRPMSPPLGNPAVPVNSDIGVPNTFAVTEVWQRVVGSRSGVVVRGQATSANPVRPSLFVSGWVIQAQATGAWSGIFGSGSPNYNLSEEDDREIASFYVPQLMAAGREPSQVFACVGDRTEDTTTPGQPRGSPGVRGARTTWLIEVLAPTPLRTGSIDYIQDLLYGDAYATRAPTVPGRPTPPTPPTPTVYGAGTSQSTAWGNVTQCAMRQLGDDLATRTLHMILVHDGHLLHSVARDWGTATDAFGNTFSRFGTVTPWEDVYDAIGENKGTVRSAAIVAGPAGVDFFFTADAGGDRYRIWHVLRHADGAWGPAKDVLALSGDAPNGTVYPFKVAAGRCPTYAADVWDESTTETVLALWEGPTQNEVLVIRVRNDGSAYSPWRGVPQGAMSGPLLSLRNVSVTVRPFRDDGVAFP